MKENMKKEDKSLASKAIDIKGKAYVLVSDRIKYFNEAFPNGGIETMILSNLNDDKIIIKALVTPDWNNQSQRFTGHAQEIIGDGFINKGSALENAETSAVGRALAMMGIGVIDSVASVDELAKHEINSKKYSAAPSKIDYNVIEDTAVFAEAKAVSKSIRECENIEQLREVKKAIQKMGFEKEVLDIIRLDFNNKMKELKKEEKNAKE